MATSKSITGHLHPLYRYVVCVVESICNKDVTKPLLSMTPYSMHVIQASETSSFLD